MEGYGTEDVTLVDASRWRGPSPRGLGRAALAAGTTRCTFRTSRGLL